MVFNIERRMKADRLDRKVVCPHCFSDIEYLDDPEFFIDLITIYGDDGPVEVECPNCEKSFYVNEIVDRSYQTSPTNCHYLDPSFKFGSQYSEAMNKEE